MLGWLMRWIITLFVLYYSIKYAVLWFAGPLLRPLGITFGNIGLRSGLSDVEYEPKKTSTKAVNLAKLSIANIRISVLFSERKVALQIAGLRARLVQSESDTELEEAQQAETNANVNANINMQDRVDRLVAQLVKTFKNAGRAVRVVAWVGLLEVYVVGIDVAVVDATGAAILVLADDAVTLHLKTDLVANNNEGGGGAAFKVAVEVSPFCCSAAAAADLLRLANETRLTLLVNMKSNTHSLDLALPEISIQSLYTMHACIARLKAKNGRRPADLNEMLQAEYNLRKDYYISLLRNAFLSTIHDFHPTISVHIAELSVSMPNNQLEGFDDFDLEVPATTARLESLALSCTLKSRPGSEGERILWVETNLSAKKLNVDAELRPGHKSSIASLPDLSVLMEISVPLLSLTQVNVGKINLTSNISHLNLVIPSRLFLVLTNYTARKKSLRKPDGIAFEKTQFWPKLFRRHYTPVVDIAFDSPFIGFRLGSYNGYNDSEDAILALFCDKARCITEATVLSTSPIRTSFHSREPTGLYKLLEMRLFMTPLQLESFVVDPYNLEAFAIQREHAVRNPLACFSESRSLITVSYSRESLDLNVDSEFAQFIGDFTCLSVSGGLDYFAVATFVAGIMHKVDVVKAKFPLQAPPFPLIMTFTLKTPEVMISASESQSCGMALNANNVTLILRIDPDLNQNLSIHGYSLSINAITEFKKPISSAQHKLKERILSSKEIKFDFKKVMKPTGILPSIRVVFPNLDLDFNLRKFYVCFTSYLPILKMTKIINARDGGASGVDIDAAIGVFNLSAVFVNGTRLEGCLDEVRGTMVGNKFGSGSIKSVLMRTLDPHEVWQEVLTIQSVALGFEKVSDEKIIIDVDGEEAIATNPSGFEFSDLFEDMINMQKGIKNLIMERMGLVSMAKLAAGKTVFKNSEMPEYRVKVGRFIFRILDDPFESKLARNYRASFEEQFGRIARDKAFQKKAMPMREEGEGELDGPIEESYWAIQEYNSKSWIRRISKATKEFPPLLNATIMNLNVVVTPPTMPRPTIEETINYIDPSTPIAIDYDDLICRDVSMSISELLLQLRDFPVPFLHVPAAHSTTAWKTEGLLIIADLLASIESKRTIELPLSPINAPPIIVTRNLCPVKVYAQSETNISVPEKHPLFMAWGMCVEPPLADMIRVLDTFTKATVDPSPPVGWWDKTRHMVHLGRTIFNIHDGDFKLRILGSMTPYYDARYHYGTEGIDVAFGKGVRVEFSDRPNENIVIESGRCTWSIPNSIHESGRISGAHRAEVKDEIFAQFVGGVKIAAGIQFTTCPENSTEEIEIWKGHSDVILKLPEYAQPAYGNVVDSYFGFRSKCIHVVYDIQSPHAKFDSHGGCSNFLSFTNDSFHRFMKLIPVYQSPLAIIPIRRGPLFEKNISNVEKPKLGRSIKTNHIKGTMFPLILSYLCEFEDATGGVGLRFGSQRMELDLMFEQKNVTIVKEGFSEASNTTRWVLDESKVEFTEVEGRTISFGSERFGSENKYQTNGLGGGHQAADMDYKKWFLDIDFNYVTKHFDMLSFVWSPKIRYFKRSEEFKFESEHKIRTEAELHKDQIKLYQKRVDDLLFIITQYINHQKTLTDQKEIMGDDSLQGKIDLITSKLESLFEKKNTIERHIRNSVKNVKDFESTKTETDNLLGGSKTKDSMFDHHYVMHNIRFLWKRDVRNICLRFFALLARDSALSYCLSNAALKTVKELLSLSIKEGAKKQNKQSKNPDSGVMGDFDSKLSEDLLQELLGDMENTLVNHEGDDDPVDTHSISSDGVTPLADLLSYTPSDDSTSPDFVAPNMCVNSSYIIQAINPQVNFESAPKTNSTAFHSVVVVAETMQFRSIHILESSANNSNMNLDEEQRQNEDLVKDRTILNIQNAQFFTCAFEAAQKDEKDKPFAYNSRDSILDDRRAGVTARVCNFWPMWVPIENVMWNEFEVDQCLERVVGRTSASVYRDKPNPLYVRRNSSTTNADFTDSYTVDFPDFRIEANSKQFFYVLDIVTNLLMYHDPTSGERSKRLRKMMLALDQMTDLTLVLDSVLVLQDKIRQGSQLLSHHSLAGHGRHNREPSTTLTEPESDHVRTRLLQFQEEMYVIMEALKALSILEQKKNSLEVALQVNIHAKSLVWTMSHEVDDKSGKGKETKDYKEPKESPLAQWTLSNSRFTWIQNEDQSSLNTLEIDHLHLENLMTSVAAFKNMISPFGDTRNVNFTRNKMVRVYWREMAPVAGIRVVDHFEMNIYPLLLQITRDTGKALEKYFFPKALAEDDEFTDSPEKKTNAGAIVPSRVKKGKGLQHTDDFKEMQTRAAENRSFVYIKVPTLQLCLSYKGAKEKNIEDLNMFTFLMPTMEYRNKTWAWQDFFSALKKDAIKAVIHNSGALVQQKLFQKTTKNIENESPDTAQPVHPVVSDGHVVEELKKKSLFGFGSSSAVKKKKDDLH
ncbi:UNVERIFIED_CONTAM: hypothetical protein HDU68_007691 [Siphonaria sp. JEL0065]|nr:hypothetical protein HDU68_007691 [Siphonaria sp. JEL0065]